MSKDPVRPPYALLDRNITEKRGRPFKDQFAFFNVWQQVLTGHKEAKQDLNRLLIHLVGYE